jgi:N-acetyl sugar amidotransferase
MIKNDESSLPVEVKFCKLCVISNQRPSSVVELSNTPLNKKPTIGFDKDGICAACNFAKTKQSIDWSARERELATLCDKHRKGDGNYDCIVPGSGGKDSIFTAHLLKNKYGMNPLTVTWAPHRYTDIGWKNFQSWIQCGFDNILHTPNADVHRLFTKLAFLKLGHPFQPFIIGQRLAGPKFSALYDIPLVMYGENAAEYGNNPKDAEIPTMDMSFFYQNQRDVNKLFIGGYPVSELIEKYKISIRDLNPYLPLDGAQLKKVGTEVHYLSYYIKWDPQENYYYAVENSGFQPNDQRSEGTYTKYSSLDDRIDPLHYYTTLIKFGIGRATYDACQEIRLNKITREEGVALVKKYDLEFPGKYFSEMLEYMNITEEQFNNKIDSMRPSHLWKKLYGEWVLKNQVS